MAVLYSFLADRYAEGDIDGSLTVQILKVGSQLLIEANGITDCDILGHVSLHDA